MIVVIDYGMGNIGSILNMLKRVKLEATVSDDKEEILNAKGLILPGVGSFDKGMQHLESKGLIDVLNIAVVENKIPILGICLGMQLLLDSSEEGGAKGLSWIKGSSKKFKFSNTKIKVPHMGWNIINPNNRDNLYKGFNSQEIRYYFVHSYYAECENSENILSTTAYGDNFASSINMENIYGVQFHPEKSHKFGMNLLKNFSELL